MIHMSCIFLVLVLIHVSAAEGIMRNMAKSWDVSSGEDACVLAGNNVCWLHVTSIFISVGRQGRLASIAAKAVNCVILAIQCIRGASATQQTEVAIIESSCASRKYWHESISGFLILCIILGIILWILIGFLTGLFYERYRHKTGLLHVRHDVQCQAPTTYTAIRGSTTPRFQPLPEHAWG